MKGYRIRNHLRRGKRHRPRKSGKGNKFPSTVRERIKRRDDWKCVRCGAPMFNIHHIKPRREGGKGTETNGICACRDCHQWFDLELEGRLWAESYKERVLLCQRYAQ